MYCSSACQRQAWTGHKDDCKRKKAQRSFSSTSVLASDEVEREVSDGSQRSLQLDVLWQVPETTAEEVSEAEALRSMPGSQAASDSCSGEHAEDGTITKDITHDDCVVEFYKHLHWPHFVSSVPSDGCVEEFFRHAEWPYYFE
eukprot:TRINITY_DN14645_c0_g1_i2.p1 TRINITY_DN14645_c0_g1~~TRINITY_DN14645_c0_g1_i2.p1  ORF type:complete len:143 (-),score=25.22 TRINITY_DN14645_c0_g1_i2:51-479(-)